MSTITRRRPRASAPAPPGFDYSGDQCIVIRDVGWHVYDCLSEAVGEGQHVRLAYDGRDMEIMTTGHQHENYKELFGKIVATVSRAKGIARKTAGETTWKRPELERGIEADQCYFFDLEKIRVVVEALNRKSNNVADYPNPDMAIEIDLSSPRVDRLSIYAMLRGDELWRFDGQTVVIEHLQQDGTYKPVQASRFLPLRAADIQRWLIDEDSSDELAWERRLEAWAKRLRRR
jgi:Uma2 family endonuclease